ncbi:type II toxin-antitoxin system death-on-curing family toxin [Micromonospora sp. S-DT3-3-22]|uniref:type II toxin-antitoxin system death-on-curing family toxin n=1 Tax=Micromonospora sp. S-DT3-3-22 TaxID=2755359 RepID=UPI00188E93D1|nr:type II toxin-antitoxin system death-on-curing family toxin [Micromonospora sp. S-DT3-3-22]
MTHPWPHAEDLLTLLAEHTGPRSQVPDAGILVAATARPHTRLLGQAAYPTALDRAAALLHGLMTWRPLDLWNAGLAWAAMRILLSRSGLRLSMPAKDRMALTDAVTSGEVDSVEELALRLSPYLEMAH